MLHRHYSGITSSHPALSAQMFQDPATTRAAVASPNIFKFAAITAAISISSVRCPGKKHVGRRESSLHALPKHSPSTAFSRKEYSLCRADVIPPLAQTNTWLPNMWLTKHRSARQQLQRSGHRARVSAHPTSRLWNYFPQHGFSTQDSHGSPHTAHQTLTRDASPPPPLVCSGSSSSPNTAPVPHKPASGL